MKIYRIIAIILAIVLLFSGCSKTKLNETEPYEEAEEKSTLGEFFDIEQEDIIDSPVTTTAPSAAVTTTEATTEPTTTGSPVYGTSLFLSLSDPDNFSPLIYEGGDFTFYYQISAGIEPAEYGIGFMLNGIYQNIKIEYDGITTGYATMHKVQIPANTSKLFKIMLRPNIGKKGDVLQFCNASIMNPSALITEDDKRYSNIQIDLNATLSSQFTMNSDSDNTATVCQSYSGMEITSYDKDIKNWFNGINDSDELCQSFIYSDLDKELYYDSNYRSLVAEARIDAESTASFPITIAMGGGREGTTQRVSVYINGEIAPVFDGKYYADIPIERKKQTNVNITVDTSKLNTWNNIYILSYTLDDSPLFEDTAFEQSRVYVLKVNK